MKNAKWITCLLAVISLAGCTQTQEEIILAKNGKALVEIMLTDSSSATQKFAAAELAEYLGRISGAGYSIVNKNAQGKPAVRISVNNQENAEGYSISIKGNDILVEGNSDRALLYAVYDFLSRLGCVWASPDFLFYSGNAEIIPHKTNLSYILTAPVIEQPAFHYRTFDVDGGRTHNAENLTKMIDWMPKLRYNTLRVPVNLNGNGRVQWDKWRAALVPELKKRGLLIQVGGHGYQNFINAGMENGTLFRKHPEWFGKDSTCRPTASNRLVFNTTNRDAVRYFINNILSYIKEHPEIDIFGLWPPDTGRWADCVEMNRYGSPSNRQAILANQVDSALRTTEHTPKLEIIAYSHALLPPDKIKLNKNILVDFCPINQNFEKPIFDHASENNAEYAKGVTRWRKEFRGDIGLYSYYRKYAWRSLPNVIPHYIQHDMQWYAKVPLNGISTYAEPGDWYTYELNHYILGYMAWNPGYDIDSLADIFLAARYGPAKETAKTAYSALEKIVPSFCSIPFSSLKPEEQIKEALAALTEQDEAVIKAIQSMQNGTLKENLSRLLLMVDYARMNLRVQEARAASASREDIIGKIREQLAFLQKNLNKGVFILTGSNDLGRFTKQFGLSNQSLLE